jgi:hypothetical protein
MKPLEIHHHPETELEVKIEVREREREREKPIAFEPSKIWIAMMQWDGLKTCVPGMDTREL